MLYNYAAASAVAHEIGLNDTQVSAAIKDFVNLEGRIDILDYKGKQIKYLRVKQGNPETIQMAIDAIALDPSPKAVALGLCIIPSADLNSCRTIRIHITLMKRISNR